MDLKSLTNTKIDYALWEVTSNCTLSCIHCRASASPDKKEENLIDGDKAFELLDSLSKLKTRTLVFSGGEPLLRQDLESLISYATSLGIRCRIQSNGLLLNKSRIKSLKKAGIISFGIGLDSPYSEHHDKIRNCQGAFKKVMDAIDLVNDECIPCHIEYTLTRLNLNQLPEMFSLLDKKKVSTFLIRSAIFSGRTTSKNKEFIITDIEYKNALTELYNLSSNYPSIKAGSQDPLYNLVNPNFLEQIKRHGNIESGNIICGCTMGINTVHIRPTGSVGVCTFLPSITLGNINDEPLEKIWKKRFESSENLTYLVKRELKGNCGLCKFRFICGGCRARSLGIYSDILEHDPYCWMNKNYKDVTV